ncbi:MAG: hypothetical protein PHQ75_07965 [Thermoguttaceae bacterium]|nr:hypothetical protein [Thermoguttaceae bacterium]
MKTVFQCSHCGASLQIDNASGENEVLCPVCGKAVTGRGDAADRATDLPPFPQSVLPDMNPYASPACLPQATVVEGQGDWDMFPAKVWFAPLFGDTFRFLFRNVAAFFVIGCLLFVLGFGNLYCMSVVPADYSMLVNFAFSAVISFISIGIVQYLVRVALEGRSLSLTNLFVGPGLFFRVITAILLFSLQVFLCYVVFVLAVLAPFLIVSSVTAFLVPDVAQQIIILIVGVLTIIWFIIAIVWCIRYIFARSFFVYFLLDKQTFIRQAFALSKKYTDKNLDPFILGWLGIVLPFAIALGALVYVNTQWILVHGPGLSGNVYAVPTLLVSSFVLSPVMWAFLVVFYLHMTNRKVGFLAKNHVENPEVAQTDMTSSSIR